MAKPPSKELKPQKEEAQAQTSKINLDTNVILIVNTIAIIAFLIVFAIINHSLNKSMIQKELANLKPTDQVEDAAGDETNVDEKGILLELGDFILNLADVSPRRYLKVNVAIELSKTQSESELLSSLENEPKKAEGGHGAAPADPMANIVAEMEQYKPAIRDSVISVLSSKTADELSSTTGKEIAKEEIQDLVSSIFNGSREVIRVSFGQFIIQ